MKAIIKCYLVLSFSVISADLWRWCPRSQFHYSINRWRYRRLQGQCSSHSSRHDSLHRLHPRALPSTGAHWDLVLSWISKSLLSYSFLSPTQINFPMCTIASMPRLPEHCVEYVRMLLWPKEKPFGGTWIHSMHIWLYCYLVVFYYFTFECVFLRWCCPRWRWPNAHPVGVPEISRKSSRVQHHWGDLQTHPGWVRRACQWDFFSNFVKSSHL